jgi:hypothetical protein
LKSDPIPSWASLFTRIGERTASLPLTEVGGHAPRVVVSVPTGQFATWQVINGAFAVTPNVNIEPSTGVNYSTWNSKLVRMDDCMFEPHKDQGQLAIQGHSDTSVPASNWPVVEVPAGTPKKRSGAAPRPTLRDELREIEGQRLTWMKWYASRCISPIVVIGDGREYLHNQRRELLDKAQHWFTHESRVLLSEDSQQTSNPERMYFHPFMVFSPGVGNSRPWLRSMRPRLVIVTSWSSYTRKHRSLFAGSPHVILANRRVASSLEAAEFTAQSSKSDLEQEIINGLRPQHGVFVKTFDEQVLIDNGDISSDDEIEIDL